MPTFGTNHHRIRAGLSTAVLAVVLAGCTSPPQSTPSPDQDVTAAPSGLGLPSEHVHGVAFNPADDKVYLATHDGLFRYDETGPVRVGPVIDLMGFTVAGPDRFYASGHPGTGVQMPDPVGLIETTDAGQTWSGLSREGVSDFHTLTASEAGVVGFEGTTMFSSPDGRSWIPLDPPVQTFALAASPSGQHLLTTSQSGPARSTDSGATWELDPAAPLLQVVSFADEQSAVAAAPDGSVFLSSDAGATWTRRTSVQQAPQAITARPSSGGKVEILIVTDTALLRSLDGGKTFSEGLEGT